MSQFASSNGTVAQQSGGVQMVETPSAPSMSPPPYNPDHAGQQGGYPPQHGGYPPQQGGYPPQHGGYPPQQGGYPPQHGGYPPQHGGYPPQHGGYPGHYPQPQPQQPMVLNISTVQQQQQQPEKQQVVVVAKKKKDPAGLVISAWISAVLAFFLGGLLCSIPACILAGKRKYVSSIILSTIGIVAGVIFIIVTTSQGSRRQY